MSIHRFLNRFQQSSDNEQENDGTWFVLKIGDNCKIELSQSSVQLIGTVLSGTWNFSRQALPYILCALLGSGIGVLGVDIHKQAEPSTESVANPAIESETGLVNESMVSPDTESLVDPVVENECPPT